MPGSRRCGPLGAGRTGRSPTPPAPGSARGPSGPEGPGPSPGSGPSAPPPGLAASALPPGVGQRPGETWTHHLRQCQRQSTPAPGRQQRCPRRSARQHLVTGRPCSTGHGGTLDIPPLLGPPPQLPDLLHVDAGTAPHGSVGETANETRGEAGGQGRDTLITTFVV